MATSNSGSSALQKAIAAAQQKSLPPPAPAPAAAAAPAPAADKWASDAAWALPEDDKQAPSGAAGAPALPAVSVASPPVASAASPPAAPPTAPPGASASAASPPAAPAPAASASDEEEDDLISAAAHSFVAKAPAKATPVPAAPPPPGSRITVRFSDGKDYPGTVEKVLDGSRAAVQYDDGQSEAVRFPDPDVRILRVGPAAAPRPKRVPLKARLATAVSPPAPHEEEEEDDDDALDRASLLRPATAWPGDKAPRAHTRQQSKPRKKVSFGRAPARAPPKGKSRRPAAPDDDSSSDAIDDIICEKCNRGDDEVHLIECDAGCGRWRHLRCCEPPLLDVPEVWACPACATPREEGIACKGDVVFAKFAHYPWWPATVRSIKTGQPTCKISTSPPRRGHLTGIQIDVLYVGRDVNATVDALRCVPFEGGLGELRSYARATRGAYDGEGKCTRQAFREAVQLAVDKACARKAARNDTSDAEPFKQALLQSTGVASKLLLVPDSDDDEPLTMQAAPPVPFAQQPLARPVMPPPFGQKKRQRSSTGAERPRARATTSGGESTSSRDSHLWYAAMLRVGVDEATALDAVRERLDCSEAFARQMALAKEPRRLSTSLGLKQSSEDGDYARPYVAMRATFKRQRGVAADAV